LPDDLKQEIIAKIDKLISQYKLVNLNANIINRRRDDLVSPVIAEVIFEYQHLLETYQHPSNLEEDRQNLVKFIKAFESLRDNSILNYLPEYEEFLRSYGY